MPVQYAEPKKRGFETMLAKDKVRLQNPQTGDFLHLSGTGITPNIAHSWMGFQYQAETLKERALTRGEDWPFVSIHRNMFEENGGAK